MKFNRKKVIDLSLILISILAAIWPFTEELAFSIVPGWNTAIVGPISSLYSKYLLVIPVLLTTILIFIMVYTRKIQLQVIIINVFLILPFSLTLIFSKIITRISIFIYTFSSDSPNSYLYVMLAIYVLWILFVFGNVLICLSINKQISNRIKKHVNPSISQK